MAEKLTPRVGDRVLVCLRGEYSTGTVEDGIGGHWCIQLDRSLSGSLRFYETSQHHEAAVITVLDREPVEWPEGWDRLSHDRAVVSLFKFRIALTLDELELILATGPEMVARWPELMGES